jgi:methionyl-tRNA formyltransferase
MSDASSVFNVFRAVTPEPGAWIETSVGRVKISAAGRSRDTDCEAGVITEQEGNVLLGLSSGALTLVRVIPAGKREMTASEWLRGIKDARVVVVSA